MLFFIVLFFGFCCCIFHVKTESYFRISLYNMYWSYGDVQCIFSFIVKRKTILVIVIKSVKTDVAMKLLFKSLFFLTLFLTEVQIRILKFIYLRTGVTSYVHLYQSLFYFILIQASTFTQLQNVNTFGNSGAAGSAPD